MRHDIAMQNASKAISSRFLIWCKKSLLPLPHFTLYRVNWSRNYFEVIKPVYDYFSAALVSSPGPVSPGPASMGTLPHVPLRNASRLLESTRFHIERSVCQFVPLAITFFSFLFIIHRHIYAAVATGRLTDVRLIDSMLIRIISLRWGPDEFLSCHYAGTIRPQRAHATSSFLAQYYLSYHATFSHRALFGYRFLDESRLLASQFRLRSVRGRWLASDLPTTRSSVRRQSFEPPLESAICWFSFPDDDDIHFIIFFLSMRWANMLMRVSITRFHELIVPRPGQFLCRCS